MHYFMEAAVLTLGILIVSLFCKVKRNPIFYVILFFLSLVIQYAFNSLYAEMPRDFSTDHPFTAKLIELNRKAGWEENDRGGFEYVERKKKDHDKDNEGEGKDTDGGDDGNGCFIVYIEGKAISQKSIMEDFIHSSQEKIDYHFNEGMRCFREAEEICLWFPNISDTEKAQLCFEEVMAMAIPGSGNVKLLAALVFAISKFGPKIMDNWHLLHSRLCECKHHFEMQEFYMSVGKYVESELNFKLEERKQRREHKDKHRKHK